MFIDQLVQLEPNEVLTSWCSGARNDSNQIERVNGLPRKSGHGEHKIVTLTLHIHLEGFSSNIDKTSRPWPRSRHWKLKSQHSTLEVTTSTIVAKDGSRFQGCSKVMTLRSKVATPKSLSSKRPRKSQHWTCDDSTLRLDELKICKSVIHMHNQFLLVIQGIVALIRSNIISSINVNS